MSEINKIAVVTGSNKGIGFAIVKELCVRGVNVVYLTARDVTRGKEAIDELKKEGLNPMFHQLEVTDEESVKLFANYLKEKHGGLDILINNAAVADSDFKKVSYEDAKHVININYYGNIIIQKYMFPVLNENARVINISSDLGHISILKNINWIERLIKDDITMKDIDSFVEWFLNAVKTNTLNSDDFHDMFCLAYKVSKISLGALSRYQQKVVGRGISVNFIHPGMVQTQMTKNIGILTTEESAKAPVYLALDIDQSVKGKYFWYDKTEKDWTDHKIGFEELQGKNSKSVMELLGVLMTSEKET